MTKVTVDGQKIEVRASTAGAFCLRSRSALLAAGLLAFAQPALGQASTDGLDSVSETGTAIKRGPREVDDSAKINRYSKAVASCVNNRSPDRVQAMLHHSDPITVDVEAADIPWKRFEQIIEECMGQRLHEFSNDPLLARIGMSFSRNRLRALLLEEAYLDDNRSAPVIAEGDPELANRQFVSTGEDLDRARGLAGFADCLAYRNGTGADALLRTEPGSAEELELAKGLAPTLGACLIAGQNIEFTPSSIRALAADGLWARAALGPKL